jgi:hypothetical protein
VLPALVVVDVVVVVGIEDVVVLGDVVVDVVVVVGGGVDDGGTGVLVGGFGVAGGVGEGVLIVVVVVVVVVVAGIAVVVVVVVDVDVVDVADVGHCIRTVPPAIEQPVAEPELTHASPDAVRQTTQFDCARQLPHDPLNC